MSAVGLGLAIAQCMKSYCGTRIVGLRVGTAGRGDLPEQLAHKQLMFV